MNVVKAAYLRSFNFISHISYLSFFNYLHNRSFSGFSGYDRLPIYLNLWRFCIPFWAEFGYDSGEIWI